MVDALRCMSATRPTTSARATAPDEFSGYRWNVGSNWPPGIERTLRLSLPPNHPATGDPVISGTVQVGEELTAVTGTGIMDDDVLDDVFTYQWVRVDADGTSNEEDITDETDAVHPDRRRPGQEGQGRGALRRHPGRRGDTHQRADGDARGNAEHPRDGRADHHGHGRGGPDADGGHHRHHGCGRADQPHLHVPVDPGGRHGGRHCGREFEHLHPGRRRPGQDDQGAGELRRRRSAIPRRSPARRRQRWSRPRRPRR